MEIYSRLVEAMFTPPRLDALRLRAQPAGYEGDPSKLNEDWDKVTESELSIFATSVLLVSLTNLAAMNCHQSRSST